MNPKIKDAAERTLATFVQAFLGVFVVADTSTLKAAAAAGVAAVLASAKAWAKDRASN